MNMNEKDAVIINSDVHTKPEPLADGDDANNSSSFLSALLIAVCVIVAIAGSVFLPSAAIVLNENQSSSVKRSGIDEFSAFVSAMVSNAAGDIADLPRVYVLPLTDDPAPVPDADNCYTETGYGVNCTDQCELLCYSDESITVRCWRETYGVANVVFSEVKISHPSQFRRGFAGGSYTSGLRHYPEAMAENTNAVIAMSADYCLYREQGLIIHQRELLRNNPQTNLDILLFDSNGDFHIMPHNDVISQNFLESHDILYSFAFGPSLIINGVRQEDEHIDSYPLGYPKGYEPRAAIGQLGKLHYLLCVVEGRSERIGTGAEDYMASGLFVKDVAALMEEKGCFNAYSMDGGQTATLIFMGDLVNKVAYGGQRSVSDILYFATACGEES